MSVEKPSGRWDRVGDGVTLRAGAESLVSQADDERGPCDAGRRALLGGKWRVPCIALVVPHVVITALDEEIGGRLKFCDKHMHQLIDEGHITDPYVSEEGAAHLAERERRGLPRWE